MARRPNELFDKEKIKKQCESIVINPEQMEAATEWLKLLKDDQLRDEQKNKSKFERIVLEKILGYTIYDYTPEQDNVDYIITDKTSEASICLEIKGTSTPSLDALQKGRGKEHETPIKQTWVYMGLGHDYGICTNYNEFGILLSQEKTWTRSHRFKFESMEDSKGKIDKQKLKEFIGLFSKKKIFSEKIFETLLKETIDAEEEFTEEFYKLYHETRLMLIKEFTIENDKNSKKNAIHWAQIFLNRLIFIFFVEDNNFIPKKIFTDRLINILQSPSLDENTHAVCDNINDLFKRMNEGSRVLGINEFNGGLFAEEIPSELFFLDLREQNYFDKEKQDSKFSKKSLAVDLHIGISSNFADMVNPIIKNLLIMDSYDFTSDANVNILGHIFEQSISDLEKITEGRTSTRRKFGVFYTPDYITDHICRSTIIPYLSNKDSKTVEELVKEYKEDINALENKIKNLKILDPACGSGAFLVKAVDILLEIDKEIQDYKPENVIEQRNIDEHIETKEINNIIENNIYGVDINEESVEITKLSLFLKLAGPDRKLAYLSNNIKVGNSLIENKNIHKLAFSWKEEFPEILSSLIENSGFDIIIGNPPYVVTDPETLSEFQLVKGNHNTYVAFIEKSIHLTKPNGKISLIVPTTWLSGNNFEELRKKTLFEHSINQIIQLPYDIFEAYIDTVIVGIDKEKKDNNFVNTFKFEVRDKANEKIIDKYNKIQQKKWEDNPNHNIIIDLSLETIYKKYLETSSEKLGDISKINRGTLPPKEYELFTKCDEDNKIKWFNGQIYRYIVTESDHIFVDYTKLREGKSLELFENPKIIGRQLVSRQFRLQFAWTEDKFAFKKNLYAIYKISQKYDPYYLLAILNSKLFSFVHVKANISVQRDDFPSFSLADFRNFLIPQVKEQKKIGEKAKKIETLNLTIQKERKKVHNRIKEQYNLEKIGSKLENFHKLNFKEFALQITKKSKIKMSLKNLDEWEEYFNEHKNSIQNLLDEIQIYETELDQMIYKIYQLEKEEENTIENTLKN